MIIENNINSTTIDNSICIFKDIACLNKTNPIKNIVFNGYDKNLNYELILSLAADKNLNLIFVNSKERFPLSFPHAIKEKNKIIKVDNIYMKFLYSSLTGKNSIMFSKNEENILFTTKEDLLNNTYIKSLINKIHIFIN